MRTKTTIAFSCPESTAKIIDKYSAKLGISRSACITMMCNTYIIADSHYSLSCPDVDPFEEGARNGD